MGIGNLPNYEFYSGYEGESEVVLNLCGKEEMSLHIWTGYFEDIFENAMLNGEGWTGFTRDIQQCERTFAGDGNLICIDIDEYLTDFLLYRDCNFGFGESAEWNSEICELYSFDNQQQVEFTSAIADTEKKLEINLQDVAAGNRNLAVSFARRFTEFDDSQIEAIKKIMQG